MSAINNTSDKLPNLRTQVCIGPAEYVDGRVVHYAKRLGAQNYLKMGPREAFLLKHLDGQTSFEHVAEQYQRAFSKRLTYGSMLNALMLFERRGLIGNPGARRDSSSADVGTTPPSQSPNRASRKIYSWNPDAGFARLAPYSRWLLNWPSLILWSCLIFLAEWKVLIHFNTILGEIKVSSLNQLGIQSFGIIFIYYFMTMLHEAGHGIACRRYGGEVCEMGIMLRYFIPSAYTRIDDILLFEKRGHRIQVLLAGPLISLSLIPMAWLAWSLTNRGSSLHSISTDLLIFYNVTCLIQFIPLMQFDGYFMLAQLLKLPELRKDALAHVFRNVMARLISRSAPPLSADCPAYVGPTLTLYALMSLIVAATGIGWLLFHYLPPATRYIGPLRSFLLFAGISIYAAIRLHHQFVPWARQQRARLLVNPLENKTT